MKCKCSDCMQSTKSELFYVLKIFVKLCSYSGALCNLHIVEHKYLKVGLFEDSKKFHCGYH